AAAHAAHARVEPLHRQLHPARHREPERAHGADRTGEPHLWWGAPVPPGLAPREARQPTPVLHGEVHALGGAAVPGVPATLPLGTVKWAPPHASCSGRWACSTWLRGSPTSRGPTSISP